MSAGGKRPVVHAAGGVLWRPATAGPEVALVHRPRYDDWSLPKGHVEPDEHPVVGGLREVVEETGFEARFVRAVGKVAYDVPRRKRHGGGGDTARKRVTYWSARAGDGAFVPNEETDELRWVPVQAGMKLLTYPMDQRILRDFARQPASTATMLIVRHAKAGRKQGYQGDDLARPLDRNGRAQAEALVDLLGAFGPGRLLSAPPQRCLQTLEPLAEETGLAITEEPTVSERAYARDPVAAHRRIREIAREGERSGVVPVVCSQGGVIPDLTAWWASVDGVRLPAARNRKASVWVLTTSDGVLLTADHIDTPLPLER
ncbi:Putative phosphohistidine phosphatase, SixA OS=Tsukamurella paurometabola (strain ATCC 8368 / DSM / CCUG 35730 / CIP 100753 / JCM 10117 / KCTC 9821 / NBRC 16120 / NCIMB 702349 / NCTC 13040) OX=521096 GN=Tpau_2845 PE=4 SV=1 [Tsukamurella paurometabola]|uniref:Putative phosphohistidine phosphatase, SixA n=1 Tax=Tsukamurella paurometabola (strain ATCC 8368 / DSM 20162 / CCUG 35730 / CIP 100753 / JCM 10117 / KCTC 9821 / NBRC 16120 / NCIMB 702349 / NCTC 13040) TaxID=521096 RepID=D5UTF8_TSUPD|nr:NUDIX hydrolase [Tsukamurella paurometabola]ADG79443.1 putative phosphohistidine phosphatase, SixA [Tsukamurella paurometabola DSM 20162]SUP35762.1 Predicted NTP pyrophosphohydrolase [Tsukamurella paurometabola]